MGRGRGSMAVKAMPPNHLTIAMLNHSQQALSLDTARNDGRMRFLNSGPGRVSDPPD